MIGLSIHRRKVETIFNLLGTKENDLSYSLGWVLARCLPFLAAVVREFTGDPIELTHIQGSEIRLQEHDHADRGFTDVEIIVPGRCYLVIEMKRGWNLPDQKQLHRYVGRPGFLDPSFPNRRLVTLSECSLAYAELICPVKEFKAARLVHHNWTHLFRAIRAGRAACNHGQKRLLDEFHSYITNSVTMQSIDTNRVWVVALTDASMKGWDISFKDVVDDHRKYFQKVSKGNPATYIAFKYRSKLHSIHFVEKCEVIMDASPIFHQNHGEPFTEPHYLFSLGRPIKPAHDVTYGKIYNPGRVYCMLDTLLTCSTIEEAVKETKRREKAFGLLILMRTAMA